MTCRTVAAVFPHVRVYRLGPGQICLLASNAPFGDPRHERRLQVARGVPSLNGEAPPALRLVGERDAILHELGPGPINEDWQPVNEYYLGRLK